MRSIGYRAVAIVLGLVGALVSLEIAARLFLPVPERARVLASGHDRRLEGENAEPTEVRLKESVDEPDHGGLLYFGTPTGMRLRANTRAVIEGHRLGGLEVEISTNSLGHRNREIGPKDRLRVLFLGDSITVQDYLPEERTIVRRVEQLSESTDEPLETVNAGVGAIGLATELAILMETGLATDPDVIVLNWYLNDVESSAGIELVTPTGLFAYSRLAELLGARVALLEDRWLQRDVATISMETDAQWRAELEERLPSQPGDHGRDPKAFNKLIKDLIFDWGSAWSEGAWDRMEPLLIEMKRQADLLGVPFLIVAFPVFDQVTAEFVYDYPQQRLAAIATEMGVPMLDLLPLLRAEFRSSDEVLYWDWCHPSPAGSEIIAAAILEFVQREG